MSKYGIPYKGSKSKIAEEILESLPAGNRLVDLFGGGFAITHCAMVNYKDKWNKFLYNDINPLLQPLIKDAIDGKYNENIFVPEWISRDKFNAEKENNGYIKWMWSFGNNGNDYLFGKNIEDSKRKVHEFVVNNTPSDITEGINLTETGINNRRLEWMKKCKENGTRRMQQLERMQQLAQLEELTRLKKLQGLEELNGLADLELANMDYREYEYKDGDIVYCDIPYADSKNKNDYGGGFDHDAFLEWARSQPFDIYYSSYTNGSVVWQKQVRSVMNSASGGVSRNEVLFKI